jgi:predicted dehydrogenase
MHSTTSRREFIKQSGRIASASALAGIALPQVHAASSDTLQVALIGCGGRGTGAASNALSTKTGPIKLVAMADVFPDKLRNSVQNLRNRHADSTDVPASRQFLGFDGYRKAMDCLRPGDIAIFATPPAFRWVHFTYAIQKGLNVFMEKPVTVDAPTTRRMIELGKKAAAKNLKVGVGLMVRHCRGRQELLERIRGGEIGELTMLRACRMGGRAGLASRTPDRMTDLMHQIRRFHAFLWASGGLFSDYNIHQVDECCWMKGEWPVKAHATGGRHFRGDSIDQNFDNYSVEYTYADGTKLFFVGRAINGCHDEFASYAHGTKGSAIVSSAAHTPGRVRTFKGQNLTRENMLWAFPQPEPNPYQLEWDDLVEAIRNDTLYNEVERGAIGSLVTSMGRMAAHTGQIITFDDMMAHDHEFAPDVDKFIGGAPAPLKPDADGRVPVPEPGVKKDREF